MIMFKDCEHARHARHGWHGRHSGEAHRHLATKDPIAPRPASRAGRVARLALSVGLLSGVVVANPVLDRLANGWQPAKSRDVALLAAAGGGDVRQARALLRDGAAVNA